MSNRKQRRAAAKQQRRQEKTRRAAGGTGGERRFATGVTLILPPEFAQVAGVPGLHRYAGDWSVTLANSTATVVRFREAWRGTCIDLSPPGTPEDAPCVPDTRWFVFVRAMKPGAIYE